MKMFISGQVVDVLVDDEDIDLLHDYRWLLSKNGYLYHGYSFQNPNLQLLSFHREIALRMFGRYSDFVVDHKNTVKLDNRRVNLRLATHTQNNVNRVKNKNNTTGYKGVKWRKERSLYFATIGHKETYRYLGSSKCPIECAKMYDRAAKEKYGEFAVLNFPE